jgi:hypothetical protein
MGKSLKKALDYVTQKDQFLLTCQFLCTIYNMSGRVVSDIQTRVCLPKGDKITNMYISFPLRKYHFHMSKYQFQSKFVEVEKKIVKVELKFVEIELKFVEVELKFVEVEVEIRRSGS